MATVNINANTSQVTQALNQVNQQITNIQTTSQTATSSIASGWASVKDAAGKVMGNYVNITSMIGDMVGAYNDAFKRQAQWNSLLLSDSYKKYSEQVNKMTESTNGMSDAYSNVASLQKIFGSEVDLSGEKLTKLTEIATAYGNRMGVEIPDAIEIFSEAVAESKTSKLEDLGVYMDLNKMVLDYAIKNGIAADSIDDLTKKEIMLNELLKLQPENLGKSATSIQQLSATTKQFRKNLDEMIVGLGDTVGKGLMWVWNENYKGSKFWGEKLYDLVHIFGDVPETIKGDVIPSIFSLTNSVNFFATSVNNVQTAVKNLGVQGAMTFKGIVANNIDAINKLQAEYDKQAAAWQKQQEIILNNRIDKMESKYNSKMAKAKETAKAFLDLQKEVNLDDFFTNDAEMRTEQFTNIESDVYDLRKKKQEDFNNWKIENIKAEFEEEKRMNEIYKSYMIDAANNIYSGLLNSRANFLQETIALSMQRAGAEIFNDGLQGLWQGGRWMLSPYPTMQAQGASTVAYSLAEIGAGLALGYAGKAAMPSTTSKEAQTKETAAVDRQNNVPKNEKTDVYLYPNEKPWIRRLNESMKKIKNK